MSVILGGILDAVGWWQARKQQKAAKQAAASQTPAQRQAEFGEKYKAMAGDFDPEPVGSATTPCPASTPTQAKAARRAQRLDLIGQGNDAAATMSDGPDKTAVGSAATRLRQDMDQVEYARAAQEVYLNNADTSQMPGKLAGIAKTAPPGMLPTTADDLDQIGLHPEDLAPPKSEFRAAVYKLDPAVWGPENAGKYVVAFRGSTPATQDWQNNLRQGLNQESSYYKQAVTIGEAIRESGNADNVRIVGHSLGGGLTSAASGAGNLQASTFNAAGLNKHTVARYTGDPDAVADPQNILAYRIKGEELTYTQEESKLSKVMPTAVGQKIDMEPPDPGISRLDLHSMTNVIASMENRKSADQATLTKATQPARRKPGCHPLRSPETYFDPPVLDLAAGRLAPRRGGAPGD